MQAHWMILSMKNRKEGKVRIWELLGIVKDKTVQRGGYRGK